MIDELENTPETFERLIKETNEYKDKYLRIAAEMENFKKRVEREKENSVKFANEKIAFDLLDVVDTFEKVLETEMPDDVKIGIDFVYKSLKKLFVNHNIIECDTSKFDPNYHTATVDNSFGRTNIVDSNNYIIQKVLRKGYLINDRLLRPATVLVGNG